MFPSACRSLVCLAILVAPALAQPPAGQPGNGAKPVPKEKPKEKPLAERLRLPRDPDQPLVERLRSPRETLKTLYFAINVYDLFPQMIEDAVACLDLGGLQPRPAPADAAMLAVQRAFILQRLDLALSSVPDQDAGGVVVLYDGEPFRIVLRRGADGGWRFDAETLGRVPEMRRAAAARRQVSPQELAGFREGFTDPRATMRQFFSDAANGDFYSAARALDLSSLSNEDRRQRGPALAQQLAFVLQRRGYFFRQEVPDQPSGPPYTWHADANGRLALERVRQPDGKDAWLFTRQTVRNIPRMYEAVKDAAPDVRYVRLGLVIPALQTGPVAARKRPDDVPPHLGSPRAVLRGFFKTLDDADADDAKLADALEYLDLDNLAPADRGPLGGKLAAKLEAVLRKLPIDLSAVSDDWNAPPVVLGDAQGVRVEIVRQRDGCWRFNEATVAHVPEMFDKLAGKVRTESGRGLHLDSARDTLVSFQTAVAQHDFEQAAQCLNLSEIPTSAKDVVGPVLAFKLEYVLHRIGRIYVQEVSDNPEGPRCILYRGDLGRITLDRKPDDPDKGRWFFAPETVQRIETMFRAVLRQPLDESQQGAADAHEGAHFWITPGVWLRLRVPDWFQARAGLLDLYQWVGLGLAALLSWVGAKLAMAGIFRLAAWLLHRFGSALSTSFVAGTLRPLVWMATVWLFFLLLAWLDLPVHAASAVFAAEKFLLAGLFAWLGLRLIDLTMAVYRNSELLRPHRSLGDMIVPVSMRLSKTLVLLIVVTYMVYQIGEFDLLGRFLTGLGVAGLAASLAAQDALKSFFGTLLLISERAFKIGDRIIVGGNAGVVEQVGFRSTRLRTSEDSLLTVPNSVIASAPIDNMGARSNRRFGTTVLVSTGTPLDRLLAFRDRLQTWLGEQRQVVRDQADVHIHQLTDGGIELSVSLFLAAANGADETQFCEAINCEILRLTGEIGVDLAPAHRNASPDVPAGPTRRAA
jgi:MscS family membrane protein